MDFRRLLYRASCCSRLTMGKDYRHVNLDCNDVKVILCPHNFIAWKAGQSDNRLLWVLGMYPVISYCKEILRAQTCQIVHYLPLTWGVLVLVSLTAACRLSVPCRGCWHAPASARSVLVHLEHVCNRNTFFLFASVGMSTISNLQIFHWFILVLPFHFVLIWVTAYVIIPSIVQPSQSHLSSSFLRRTSSSSSWGRWDPSAFIFWKFWWISSLHNSWHSDKQCSSDKCSSVCFVPPNSIYFFLPQKFE